MEPGLGGGAHRRTAAVQAINYAATSKLSCVNKGYISRKIMYIFRQKTDKDTMRDGLFFEKCFSSVLNTQN